MQEDKLPQPIATLEEIVNSGADTTETPYKVFIGDNLGGRTFLISIPMHELYRMSEVANVRGKEGEAVAQRPLDRNHARKLALYMLKGLVMSTIIRLRREESIINEKYFTIQSKIGKQPYLSLQPIVANLRTCSAEGKNIRGYRLETKMDETAGFKVFLSQKDILWIVDGQHRRKGLQEVFEFLDYILTNHKYPGKNMSLYPEDWNKGLDPHELQVWQECYTTARAFCKIAVELHLGLNVEQERQLFHDLNNLGKKVTTSLALQFDNSNPVNLFIKEELMAEILEWTVVDQDIVNWTEDVGTISLKDLVSVNARLMLNKNNASGALPLLIENRKEIARRFWRIVTEIPGINESQPKLRTVAAQPVVLKAMAKLVYDYAFNPREANPEMLERILDNFLTVDFSHSNPMWRYYELSDNEKVNNGLTGLKEYLPSDDEGFNRDIGGYDSVKGLMRFGAKHNDIFPILADMIRWKLDLPNRRYES